MSFQTFNVISIIGFVMAGIFLILAVVLYFVFDVSGLVNELSGKKAEREMEQIRSQRANVSRKPRKNTYNAVVSRMSEKESSIFDRNSDQNIKDIDSTASIEDAKLHTAPIGDEGVKNGSVKNPKSTVNETEALNATEILCEESDTQVLGTEVLYEEKGTTMLEEDTSSTTVLDSDNMEKFGFKMEESIIVSQGEK